MEERIGIYIKKINDYIEKNVNKKLKEYNLTMTQGRVLCYLSENKLKKVTQKELEREFNISHATISGIISRLEINGFVKVNRSKRINTIELVKQNLELENQIKYHQNKLENIMCFGLDSRQIETFINYLNLVYENLKEEEDNG